MPALHHARRPRASPLWQIIHQAWDDFLAGYEKHHRRAMGPLRPDAVANVRAFMRCGDLAAGFTRFHCPGCGHEKLLAFTCKSRHFCPACHQRRTRQTGAWIAASVYATARLRRSGRRQPALKEPPEIAWGEAKRNPRSPIQSTPAP